MRCPFYLYLIQEIMFVSPILSVFYVISVAFVISGIFLFKKSEKKLDSASWFIASCMLFLCGNAFIASIINLVHIPINLLSMGLCNCAVAGALWFFIIRFKKIQHYQARLFDWSVLVIIAAVAIIIGLIQFGPSLNIRYITSDPSNHMATAMDIINTQSVQGMFFGPLNNALMMSVGMPFVHQLSAAKLFIMTEFIMFALHGWIFYILVNRFSKNRFTKVFSVLVTILYMVGYPLNNMVFGFNYLGTGVTVLAFLLFLADIYYKKEVNRPFVLLSLMLSCLAIFLCYMLFMPFAYIALFLFIAWDYQQQKKLISWEMVRTQLVVFLLPVIIGLIYCFFGWFGSASEVGNALAAEGYIYRDLYSNFVIWLPIALFGFARSIKKKEWMILQPFSILWLCFIAVLFVLGMSGKASSYYYFKTYYVLWMVTLALFQLGISYFSEKSKEFVVSYLLVWGFVGTMCFSGIDQKISDKNVLFNPEIRSGSQYNIYLFNKNQLETAPLSVDAVQLDLYSYLLTNFDQSELIPIAEMQGTTYWYQALTNQRLSDYYLWNYSPDDWVDQIVSNCNYVVIMNSCEEIQGQTEFLESLEVVYSNPAGYIAKITK